MNGQIVVKDASYQDRIAALMHQLAKLWKTGWAAPRSSGADWRRHIYRELNKDADALANRAMDRRASEVWWSPDHLPPFARLRAYFDGGRRAEDCCSCGWLLQGMRWSSPAKWHTFATGSIFLAPGTTSVAAELTGLEQVTKAVVSACGDHGNEQPAERRKVPRLA